MYIYITQPVFRPKQFIKLTTKKKTSVHRCNTYVIPMCFIGVKNTKSALLALKGIYVEKTR
ncbi:hypothetical protein BEL04_06045 [Mucilaginibacter sp. PPCGB 2223]|nr:hypothetical protein BEL04_06045 [Mucilaginibacter sp. PPCGB 2223]